MSKQLIVSTIPAEYRHGNDAIDKANFAIEIAARLAYAEALTDGMVSLKMRPPTSTVASGGEVVIVVEEGGYEDGSSVLSELGVLYEVEGVEDEE